MVGHETQQRLQKGRRHLKGDRDQPDLHKVQVVRLLEQRVQRRDHRLNEVVEQMRPAQCQ